MVDSNTIKAEIDANPVMVFSKGYCHFCTQAKDLLKQGGVAFKAIEMDEIDNGNAMHSALKTYSGQNTVPNIYIAGKHVGGCSDIQAAHKNGQLKNMLNAAGVKHSF